MSDVINLTVPKSPDCSMIDYHTENFFQLKTQCCLIMEDYDLQYGYKDDTVVVTLPEKHPSMATLSSKKGSLFPGTDVGFGPERYVGIYRK